jgi:polyhydroxyalkanoate synthesis repressor PhaR
VELIKKYGNRKLYHTNAKQYITLHGIGKLIRAGLDVRVIDNVTGEDLTVQTLSQILLHNKGRRSGPLPIPVLSDLIQTSGETLSQMRRTLFHSVGGDQVVDAEIRLRLEHLLDEGKISEDECQRMGLSDNLTNHVEHLPDRSDVDRLKTQVEDLSRLVEQLLQEHSA